MKYPAELYNTSLAMATDLYQLTMAYGYWRNNLHEEQAVFNLFFRKNPFGGKFAIAAGLEPVIRFLENFRFEDSDIAYLSKLTGRDGKPLFNKEFLRYLREMEFSCTVHGVREGTPIFPFEPLIRVTGPIIQCQLLETALLNIVNFQTLIATKAARVCKAAHPGKVVEFGLRRAQGLDGGLAASRAAYIGGCSGTSNVLAGKIFGIPVVGTHAHSWVMSFPTEKWAFEAYAWAMPNNCVFLVDTYDTLKGVENAILEGKRLREKGYDLAGIRLDSGDLATLSKKARQMLDESGFTQTNIVASNDLDEEKITELKSQGACIDVWGVGTNLVTGDSQPALGGVYKLAGMYQNGIFNPVIKISEDPIKITNPGLNQTIRWYTSQSFFDVIADSWESTPKEVVHLYDAEVKTRLEDLITKDMEFNCYQLQELIFQSGSPAYTSEMVNIEQARSRAACVNHEFLEKLIFPPTYLDKAVFDLKAKMIKTHLS